MDLDWIGLSVTGIIAGRSLLLCIESEREFFSFLRCCENVEIGPGGVGGGSVPSFKQRAH